MHPDIMAELIRQRGAERREAARNASVVRALRKATRARRTRAQAPDNYVLPPVPDYVDDTFHIAQDQVPVQRAGTCR